MGSVTLWMQMSLDGFAEGPDQDVYWPIVDEELFESFLDELRQADLFLYGRKTYEIMSSFWPTADKDPVISEFYVEFAQCWQRTPKIVFSRTLRSAGWNIRVVRENLVEEVALLRVQPDCRMVLFGGAETAAAFMRQDLIDEYRLFVHPLLLGSGVPLFQSSVDTAGLRLVDVTTYDSAVVQVHYKQTNRG